MINKFFACASVCLFFFNAGVRGADLSVKNKIEVTPISKKDSSSAIGTVNQNYQIHAKRTEGIIKLDGI
ncbi:MAG TPA: hypothetical protein VGK38_02525, partial [Prolixibacteraceae bacterium]